MGTFASSDQTRRCTCSVRPARARETTRSLESNDEAKAPTRQFTVHKDLLSSSELDETVTNAIEIRQMQQAENVTAFYCKCSRDIKEPLHEMKSGRHIRAKPCASRLMIPARGPFSFIRVCEVVYIAGDVDETSEARSCRIS